MTIGIASERRCRSRCGSTSAGKAPELFEGERRQPLQHTACTASQACDAAAIDGSTFEAALASGIHFTAGDEHLLEISFDDEALGMSKDLRPSLPIILRY
jgi:hypothetical protein